MNGKESQRRKGEVGNEFQEDDIKKEKGGNLNLADLELDL